jgi:DNA-binding response OmpR family regulator
VALAGSGFEVVAEAGDGRAAVVEAGQQQPDLVLLDCTLPGGDAFDALPGLRKAAPDARIVLVSGYDPADLRLASRSAGAIGYLTKETPARHLATELDALIGLVGAVEQLLAESRHHFEQDATSPRAARRFVSEVLTDWDDGDLTDTVTLLVSELVTNAVVHAGSDVEVSVRLTATAARVEVTDTSAEAIAPRDAGSDEDSGRGLALVGTLARRWGVRPAPDGGKTVWFEIDRDPGGRGSPSDEAP